MAKQPFACGDCNAILPDGEGQCHVCPNSPVTTDWQGFVAVSYTHLTLPTILLV